MGWLCFYETHKDSISIYVVHKLNSYRYLNRNTSISSCSSSCSTSTSLCSSSSSSESDCPYCCECNIDKYNHSSLPATSSTTSFRTESSSIPTISSFTFYQSTCIIDCFCAYEYCSSISSSSPTVPTSITSITISSTSARTRWSFILSS